jgi:hypothetical protein
MLRSLSHALARSAGRLGLFWKMADASGAGRMTSPLASPPRSAASSGTSARTPSNLYVVRATPACHAGKDVAIGADEHNHLRKLGGAKLGRDLVHAAMVEQQDSSDHVFGHALSGPAYPMRRKIETETIRHGSEDISAARPCPPRIGRGTFQSTAGPTVARRLADSPRMAVALKKPQPFRDRLG